MGENQTIQVGNDMQVSYEALKADIMQELREAGAKEIPSVYNGFVWFMPTLPLRATRNRSNRELLPVHIETPSYPFIDIPSL